MIELRGTLLLVRQIKRQARYAHISNLGPYKRAPGLVVKDKGWILSTLFLDALTSRKSATENKKKCSAAFDLVC